MTVPGRVIGSLSEPVQEEEEEVADRVSVHFKNSKIRKNVKKVNKATTLEKYSKVQANLPKKTEKKLDTKKANEQQKNPPKTENKKNTEKKEGKK